MKKFILPIVAFCSLCGVAAAFIIFVSMCTGTVDIVAAGSGGSYTVTLNGWCRGSSPDVNISEGYYTIGGSLLCTYLEYGAGIHNLDWPEDAYEVRIIVGAFCNGYFFIEGWHMYCSRSDSDEATILNPNYD